MGQKISQSKNTVDINVYLNKFYSSYTPLKVLNNGMLNKTVLLLNEGENKCPLVAKIFFKQDYEEEYKKQLDRIIETQNKIVNECLHNVLPLIYKVENNRSGIIFRQYLEFNLKERIYLMPYLNNIQKLWISFQILYAVNDIKTFDGIDYWIREYKSQCSQNAKLFLVGNKIGINEYE